MITALALFLIAPGCLKVNESKVESEYFDLTGLLQKNIAELVENNAVVQKIAIINMVTDTVQYQPDSMAWGKELKLFEMSDISRPALNGLYKIDITEDEESNLKVLEYHLMQEGSKIPEFKVYYYGDMKGVVKIEAVYLEEGSGMVLERKLVLEFSPFGRDNILSSWNILGRQKLSGLDTLHYQIIGNIKMP